MDPQLAEATQRHLQGDLDGAAVLYQARLARWPDDPDALYLLGTLELQRGATAAAMEHLARLTRAHPSHLPGLLQLAVALRAAGDADAAAQTYWAVLKRDPGELDAYVGLSELMQEAGALDAALECARELTERAPDVAAHWFRCGVLNYAAGDLDAAERDYREALRRAPTQVEVLCNLGAVRLDRGDQDEARALFERALQYAPGLAQACRGAGSAALKQGDYAAAVHYLRDASAQMAEDPEVLSDLGVALRKAGRLTDAIAAQRQALACAPQHVNAHFNLGVALLQAGSMAEGWREYEWRLRIKGRTAPQSAQPLWQGEALAGRRILVRAEQGYGDTFQFVRYCELLARRGAHVIFECQPGLKRVLGSAPGIATLVERTPAGEIEASFDYHVPLLSLPHRFQTELADIPNTVPYLRAEPAAVARWQARLHADARLKVGLVWAGRASNEDDRDRSCPAAALAPLFTLTDVAFFSLQLGDAAAELAAVPGATGVEDLAPELEDFAETAAAIEALDLVISVDTAVAHLAGALGRPVWVLLCHVADWRYLEARADSPWYPSMRLFRQPGMGDWAGAVAAVKEALLHLPRPPAQTGTRTPQMRDWQALAAARSARAAGELVRAQHSVEALLEEAPEWAEARLLLGQVLLDQGNAQAALTQLALARAAYGAAPNFQALLGRAYFACGEFAPAVRALDAALREGNESAELWHLLARACERLGNVPEAAHAYARVLAWNPRQAEAAERLSQIHLSGGRLREGLEVLRRSLSHAPEAAPLWLRLSNILQGLGDRPGAMEALRRAVALAPDLAAAHNDLGVMLKASGALEEAASHLRAAVEAAPDFSPAYNNLGNVLLLQDQPEAAEQVFRTALARDPANVEAYNNLGIALQAIGSVEAALQCFDMAVKLRPRFAAAHWNRAIALLLRGDYRAGWGEYEWGFASGARLRLPLTQPEWQGETQPGKTLLIYAEQGLGDTLQYVRFLPAVRARVGRVVLCCPVPLVPLLVGVAGADRVIGEDAALPSFDLHCALMSVPHRLGLGAEAIGMARPYLVAPARPIGARVAAAPGPRIGLVWAGSPQHQHDHLRSLSFGMLRALAERPGVSWFSLQKGPAALTGTDLTQVIDLAPDLHDFADTASALAALDLVITVDTAVAHLAGALGRPAWVLLPFAPDWRWGQRGTRSPWYPSLRLFRQSRRGDWAGVVAGVDAALSGLLSGPAGEWDKSLANPSLAQTGP